MRAETRGLKQNSPPSSLSYVLLLTSRILAVLSVCLSVYPAVCPSVRPSVLSACPPVSLSLSLSLFSRFCPIVCRQGEFNDKLKARRRVVAGALKDRINRGRQGTAVTGAGAKSRFNKGG